jgi:hypothetical protein
MQTPKPNAIAATTRFLLMLPVWTYALDSACARFFNAFMYAKP